VSSRWHEVTDTKRGTCHSSSSVLVRPIGFRFILDSI
jgi:hypothetical protein